MTSPIRAATLARFLPPLTATLLGVAAPVCFAQPSITFFSSSHPLPAWAPEHIHISDMSADGTVVAGAAFWSSHHGPEGNDFETWRWTAATGYTHFGYGETGGSTDYPLHLTEHGEQVVYTTIGGGSYIPIRWTPPATTVVLPHAEHESIVRDVSADGRVVVGKAGRGAGWWYLNGFGGYLGVLPGALDTQSTATAVNADGTVIVGVAASWDGDQAFRWTSATGMQGLGQLLTGMRSEALAVSGDGLTVAGYAYANGGYRAFKWVSPAAGGTGVMEQLPAPFPVSNFFGSYAKTCSNDGSLIGGNAWPTTSGQTRAVLWHSQMGPIDLTSYAAFRRVNLQGRTLISVERISGDGRTIAGLATNGVRSVYVLHLEVAFPCGAADVGGPGGAAAPDGYLDNNDFVAFLGLFVAQSAIADMGSTGGVPGADGEFNNNDFVAFIDRFFGGCV